MNLNIKIGIIQLTSSDNLQDNCNQLEYYLYECKKKGADFILSPEVSNFISTDCELKKRSISLEKEDTMICMVKNFCYEFKVWSLIGSVIIKTKKNLKDEFVNRSILINSEGKIVARYDKIHMFDVNLKKNETYQESKNFRPGSELVLAKTPFAKIGLTICYDIRFPYLFKKLKSCGADIICIPSAFTIKTGKDHWETLVRARAIENNIFIIAPAQCGKNTFSRQTWGQSLIVNPNGKILSDLGNKVGYDVLDLIND